MEDILNRKQIIDSVRQWVETMVIGLNLCPFAKDELVNKRIRFTVSEATTEEDLLIDLQTELALLGSNEAIETTLLIHPQVLRGFYDYNQFLNVVDGLLMETGLEGVFQIASFHPDYQFGGTEPGDAENYTNKPPYPILHLLRETSLERAIASYPDAGKIPERNITLMKEMGAEKLKALLQTCFKQRKQPGDV
ncbi:MAG: DUF1415 domain-containing protein [Porticoccaceae bacterium]|nr:DUF1415 domain-containing protein [Porticoccaceae bacterium]